MFCYCTKVNLYRLCVGKHSRRQKNSGLRSTHPRSSSKMHTRFRSCSHQPSVAEVDVGEERRCIFPQLGHTSQPREYRSLLPSHDQSHEQAPRRRVVNPSTGIHAYGTEVQQRSAVQRRTPLRKLEGENPNRFSIRAASNRGLIV